MPGLCLYSPEGFEGADTVCWLDGTPTARLRCPRCCSAESCWQPKRSSRHVVVMDLKSKGGGRGQDSLPWEPGDSGLRTIQFTRGLRESETITWKRGLNLSVYC